MSDFIERARALDAAATAGPWGVEGSLFGPEAYRNGQAWGLNWRQDLEWVAAARSMLPAAVEALARVRELHRKSKTWTHMPRWARETEADAEPYRFCVECRHMWPCETYEATEVDGHA